MVTATNKYKDRHNEYYENNINDNKDNKYDKYDGKPQIKIKVESEV